MTTIQLIQFRLSKQYEASVDDAVQKITATLRNISSIQDFTIGTELEDKTSLQIITQDPSSPNDTTTTDLLTTLHTFSSGPPTTTHLTLHTSSSAFFGSSGPVASPIVEYVQSWFPAAEATPSIRRQVEQGFERFSQVFKREARGDGGSAYGWIEEEVEREDVKGGKATAIVTARGWETFEAFQASVNTQSFREAMPILSVWAAPHRMWFVEKKGGR